MARSLLSFFSTYLLLLILLIIPSFIASELVWSHWFFSRLVFILPCFSFSSSFYPHQHSHIFLAVYSKVPYLGHLAFHCLHNTTLQYLYWHTQWRNFKFWAPCKIFKMAPLQPQTTWQTISGLKMGPFCLGPPQLRAHSYASGHTFLDKLIQIAPQLIQNWISPHNNVSNFLISQYILIRASDLDIFALW